MSKFPHSDVVKETDPEKIVRAFESLEDESIDDADYDKEFPLPAPHERSTCRCGASYDEAQFMALALPEDGEGVWTFESATFAARRCGKCDTALGRRIA